MRPSLLFSWLALFIAVACTGPHLALQPQGLNIQAQCGVDGSFPVTKDQALCIAELAGLEKGGRRWGVIDEGKYWQIFNYTGRRRDGPKMGCENVKSFLREP